MRKPTGCIAVAALLLALGCGGREDPPAPALGVVEFANGRVRLQVEDAEPLGILEQLAAQAGFELVVAGVTPRRISLRLDGVPLAVAIGRLLPEERFSLEYAFDRNAGEHVIAVLRVGRAKRAPRVASAKAAALAALRSERPRAPARARAKDPSAAQSEPDPGDRARVDHIGDHRERIARLREELARAPKDSALERRLREELSRERSGLQEEIRNAIDDPDPALRADAVREIDTEQRDNRARVSALGKSDPDPTVRVAAAERLAGDGTFASVSGLLGMLEDSNPAVLVATIEALDFAGDESLSPHLEPLSRHPDPAVREAANELLEQWGR
jgi:hypothetical protein